VPVCLKSTKLTPFIREDGWNDAENNDGNTKSPRAPCSVQLPFSEKENLISINFL